MSGASDDAFLNQYEYGFQYEYGNINLCNKSSLTSVVVSGASDDAALDAPSPLFPTHQFNLKNLLKFLSYFTTFLCPSSANFLVIKGISTCGSGGGAGGPGDGVRGGLISRCGGTTPFGCFTNWVSSCGGGGRGGPGLLESM